MKKLLFLALLNLLFFSTGLAQWEQANGPYGGCVICLEVDPITGDLYAGTFAGGVFKSTNNGSNWTSASSGITNAGLYVKSIAISGSNIFAGTYRDGIFLSSDNGNSWTAINNGLSSMNVQSLAVSGANIFAATGGGMFLSTNNGGTWAEVNNGLTFGMAVFSIATSGSNIFAGTTDGVFLSTDNGSNWTLLYATNLDEYVITLAVDGSNIFAGTNTAGIYASNDNGINWAPSNTGLTGTNIHSIVINGAKVFAGTMGGGICVSTNDGNSWSPLNTGLSDSGIQSIVIKGSSMFAGTTGGVFLSPNEGNLWYGINSGLSNTGIQTVSASGNNIIAGTWEAGAFLSENNSSSWNQVNAGLAAKVNTYWVLNTFTFDNGNIYSGTDEGIFLTTNNGASWSDISNGLTGSELHVKTIVIDNSTIIIGTSGGGVLMSTNAGGSWTAKNSGLTGAALNVRSILVSGSSMLAGTYAAGVFLSTDDGDSWTPVNTGLTGYALYVMSLATDGSTIFAGTGGGIFSSTDGGVTWSRINTGLADSGVTSLVLNGNNILARTSVHDVFVSKDNGLSWVDTEFSQIPNYTNGTGPTAVFTYPIAINETEIFSGTAGNGIWKRLLSDFKDLSLLTDSITIEAQASSTNTFDITSNTDWTISSDQAWLTADYMSGSGDATITLTAEANTTFSTRTATITVSGTDVTSQTITVIQDVSGPGSATLTGSGDACSGSTSTIKSVITGGTPPYTIHITGYPDSPITNYASDTDIDLGILPAGVHSYTITSVADALGKTLPVGGLPSPYTIDILPMINISVISDTICNSGSTNIIVESPTTTTYGIRYTWTVVDNPNVQGESNSTGEGQLEGTAIIQTLVNTSPETQHLQYTITPWSIDIDGNNLCSGIPAIVDVWVEPELLIYDTWSNSSICSGEAINIFVESYITTSNGLIYTWTVADNPKVIGESSSDAEGQSAGTPIVQFLNNWSPDTAHLIYHITPWALDSHEEKYCSGTPIIVDVIVEPEYIELDAFSPNHMICSGEDAEFIVSSPYYDPSRVLFTWTVEDNPEIIGASNGPDPMGGMPVGLMIAQNLINTSNSPQVIKYTFEGFIINEDGMHCPGMSIMIEVEITVNPSGQVEPVSDQIVSNGSLCSPDPFNTINTGGTTSYSWANNDPSIGLPASGNDNIVPFTAINSGSSPVSATITVTPDFQNGNTCSGPEMTFTITVNSQILFDPGSIGSDQTICAGSTPVSFTSVAPSGDGIFTYQWYSSTDGTNFTLLAGATSETHSPSVLSDDTWYKREVISTVGGDTDVKETNTVRVTVNNLNPGSISADQQICEGEVPSVFTGMSASGDGAITYQWMRSTDGVTFTDIAGAVSESFAPGSLALDSWYKRKATSTLNGLSCEAESNPIKITVRPLPTPTISGSATVAINSTGIVYSTEAGMSDYVWDISSGGTITFGGGSEDNVLIVTWTEAGAQTVTVSYSGIYGCVAANPTVYPVTVSSAYPNYDTVTDIDGNTYKTVTIGKQTWMAENLRVTKEADGTAIPLVTGNTAWANLGDNDIDKAYCYHNNNVSNEADTYGAIYTYAAAKDACPSGWHLPTDAEWTELTNYIASDGHSGTEGYALKSTTGWLSSGNGTDDYGYKALPGGYRDPSNGSFNYLGSGGTWWSSTMGNYFPYVRSLYSNFNSANLVIGSYNKSHGFSVRCLKESETLETGITVNDTVSNEGDPVIVPIAVSDLSGGDNIISYQFDIDFDNTVLEYSAADLTGTLAEGGTVEVNTGVAGRLSVSYMNSTALVGTGDLLKLQFNTLLADTTTVSISNAYLNTTEITELSNGIVIVKDVESVICENMALALTTYDASCNGNCNGVATVSTSGGQAPYTYSWSNGATGPFQLNLCKGDYMITVNDAQGCTTDSVFSINEPDVMEISHTSQDVVCAGRSDGTVTTTIFGGTAPYSYLWDNGTTTQNLSGVASGIYTLTATDANGCTAFDIADVQEPDSILISSVVSGPSCAGMNDATIEISVSGGVLPYTYLWNNVIPTEDLSGLPPGIYNLTVTDATGCEESASFEISDPEYLMLNVNPVYPACNGEANGSVVVEVTGGTAPYTYAWSNGASTPTIDNLVAGNYTLTVNDLNGCEIVTTAELVNPEQLEINLIATNPACEGVCNGSITAEVTGGTAPYSYSWSNGAAEGNLVDLCAGSYELTVTDANGCVISASQELSWASVLTGAISVSDITCAGMCNGYAIAMGAGGDGSFTYDWSDGQTGSFRSNLCEDLYNVTIKDGQGCEFELSDSIRAPKPILIQGNAYDATCKGEANGSISIIVSGGTPEYTYQWISGQTSQNITDVYAGNYNVNVRDANGCFASANFMVSEPADEVIAIATVTDVNCYGEATGAIALSVSGGMEPYQFVWSNGIDTRDLADLLAGSYQVNITDATGCSFVSEYIVSEPGAALEVSGTVTEVSCSGEATGAITLSVSGGTAPYQFAWSNGSTSQDLADLLAGVYQVTITDANGCSITNEYTVTEPAALVAIGTITDVDCYGEATGAITLSVTGGKAPYQFIWSDDSDTRDLIDLVAGNYQVTITDANGCKFASEFTVSEADAALEANAEVTDVVCSGAATGAITLSVTGGVEPYGFAWSNGSTSQDLTDILAGVYQVTITDASGCAVASEYSVAEPAAALEATGVVNDVSCFGETTGAIALSVSGGAEPYEFAWSNGTTTHDLADLLAGVYQVSITDANGCAFAGEFTVTEPSEPLSVTGFASEATCSGEANGNITLSVIGGTPPYQFEWSNGSTSQDQIGIESGSYQVNVRDANACTTSWSGEVLVQAGAVLTGYAQHSNGYVLEDEADVVLYEASSPHNHEVARVRTGPDGSFSFTDISEGQYILYVKLDNHDKQTYHGVMSSYYGNTYKWKEAEIIQLSCEDNEAIVVDMFENPAYTKGNGKAGGKVSHESSLLKIAPFPVIDAQVFLIDEFNGLPVSLVTTDENGAYAFSEIAVGDYSIYVDIPGITQQTTHYFSITDSDTEQLALDFVVDVVWDMDINSVSNTSIPEIINILNSISIFPNPTNSEYIMLQSSLLNQRELEVVIISEAGSIMLQRDLYVIGGQIKLDLFGFIPGNYILRMKIDSEIQYRKIVVLK